MSDPSNTIAGISGGRSSGRMHYMLPSSVVRTFQNTGEEDERTLSFLCRMEDDLGIPIVRLEWRPPPRRGDPPRLSTFEVVTHATMSRRGEPFRELLETLSAYRRTKGQGPVAPWARVRLCTAHLKIKTKHRYAMSLGFDEGYTDHVGLRYDEPERIHRHREAARSTVNVQFPLYSARITKPQVLAWWRERPFDLDLPEYLGNCRGCFMKDERDLASAFLVNGSAPERWIGIERDFGPMRRGGRPSYAQVLAEAPARMQIREQVRRDVDPNGTFAGVVRHWPEGLDAKRRALIVAQERKPASDAWSCNCEGAELLVAE